MPQKILVIEDEPAIADNITYALKTEGFEPIWCTTGAEGKEVLSGDAINLIILDIGLPDINGFELCKEIRKTSDVPILFLTARADEIDRVVGLEIGGDDYMVKPFSPRELTARIKAILRRTLNGREIPTEGKVEDTSPFTVDHKHRRISYYNTILDLCKYEFNILKTLIDHPGRVFSREQLMEKAWDVPDVSLERTVDTHINRIRNKLRAIKPDYDPIETRRGFGYALKVQR